MTDAQRPRSPRSSRSRWGFAAASQEPDDGGPTVQSPEPHRQAPPPPTPPDRGGLRALVFGVAGLVLTFFFLPVGLLLCIAAIVIGVRARRRGRRLLAPVPGSIGGLVTGSVGVVVGLFAVVGLVMAGGTLVDYKSCWDSAITVTDKHACQQKYNPRLEHDMHFPDGSLKDFKPAL